LEISLIGWWSELDEGLSQKFKLSSKVRGGFMVATREITLDGLGRGGEEKY